MTRKSVITIAIAVGALGSASRSFAQQVGVPPNASTPLAQLQVSRPGTYGTQDVTSHVVSAWDFLPFNTGTSATNSTLTGARYLTLGGFLEAPVHIPNGAVLTGFELQGCDTSPFGFIYVSLFSNTVTPPTESVVEHGTVGSTDVFASGCAFFFAALPNITVNNSSRHY